MWIFVLIILLIAILIMMFWFYHKQETRFQDELDEFRQRPKQPENTVKSPTSALVSNENEYETETIETETSEYLEDTTDSMDSMDNSIHQKTVIIFPENDYLEEEVAPFRQPEMAMDTSRSPTTTKQEQHKSPVSRHVNDLADQPSAIDSIKESDPFFTPPTTLSTQRVADLLPPEQLKSFAFELIDDEPPMVITLEEATRNLRGLRETSAAESSPPPPTEETNTEDPNPTPTNTDDNIIPPPEKIDRPEKNIEPIDEIEAIRMRVAADIASAVAIKPTNAPAVLVQPAPDLEVITIEDALRAMINNHDNHQNEENKINHLITEENQEDEVKEELQYDDVLSAAAVRERTLQHVPQPSPKPLPLDAETISEDEIRESLLRQRLARRQQLLAEAPVHSLINQNMPTIPEDEVFANLARSNRYAPAARQRQRLHLNEQDLVTPQNQHQRPMRSHYDTPTHTQAAPNPSKRAPIGSPHPRTRHRPAINTRLHNQPDMATLARFTQISSPPQPNPPAILNPNPVIVPSMVMEMPITPPPIVEQNIHFPPPAIVGADYLQAAPLEPNYHHYPIQEQTYYPAYKAQQEELIREYDSTPPTYPLPTTALLLPAQHDQSAVQSEEQLLDNGIIIEEKLAEFRVKVKVIDAYSGPVITRYEIEPDTGVRGNSVLNLEKDLARSLGMGAIRVVETIPGKNCMGIELPNPKRQMIRLSEIFNAPEFTESRSKLTLALGQDITGQPVVTDLAKAPHLLVAGTTGSGKSVGVNSMILSLLFKATPEDVRLIMIDPKMLELSVYEGIPHLLTPVITDMKYAANALNWCVNEMEKRYRLMSHLGVRNLAGYNAKILEGKTQGHQYANPFSLSNEDPEPLEKLPFIVVVVDEFADLMMTAGKKIEELIARLAQKARAAGIHLILATQRPSVDVITGLIKANIPTRIAFQVSSKVDSRTILDQMGAENLLGQGDMLFLPPGMGYPQRVHGAFVADSEVHEIVEYLKQFGEPDYVEDIIAGGSELSGSLNFGERNPNSERDPLFDEAVATILRTQKPTISSLQRFLRIGYNKAATLFDQMEAEGIVSPADAAGKRTILAHRDSASDDS